MAGLFQKDDIELTSDSVTTINNAGFADQVRNDPGAVVQHLSEVIGPVAPADISVDQHGKVVINNRLFANAAKVGKVTPLDNILCNHHFLCS